MAAAVLQSSAGTPPSQDMASHSLTAASRTPSPASSSKSRNKSSRSSSHDSERLPSQDEIFATSLLPLLDSEGQSIPFENIYSRPGRHLVIWVRHFFCGMCQEFLRNLVAAIPQSSLDSLDKPTSITIIGCGSPELIPDYATFSGDCPYPIYADPNRQTYQNFGMENNLDMGPGSPDYQTSSVMHIIVRSIWQGITSGSLALKGGKSSQLGGEMLFEDGKVVWCHRMRNTRDHTEVADIKTLLGL